MGNGVTQGEKSQRLPALALAALGVVFGDIGTSPLYAMHVCFSPTSNLRPTPENVLGVVSLITWALLLVVTLKYVVFVMRADLNGEGGILALMALATQGVAAEGRARRTLVALGLVGTALLYGDGMITPAISVLSAIEGIKVATPLFVPAIQPLTIAVLIALFCVQHRGTGAVGAVFGPVMLVWFAVLTVLGLTWIAGAPAVLEAVSPYHGIRFLLDNGWAGYLILGSVFLAVTGGEALYADIGHFGTRPIRLMWVGVVLPAVLINYYGQAALLLQDPTAVHHTFYRLAPDWALAPLVVLATAAAVIASQAIISGAFSLTAQAVELGYAPRLTVRHSSAEEEGQVYVPLINWTLLAAALFLVLHFGSSDTLASAYGVAVSGTMVLTTLLAAVYFRARWGLVAGLLLAVGFLPIDLAFLGANMVKLDHGAWFPVLVAGFGYLLLSTWTRGVQLTRGALERMAATEFAQHIAADPPLRAPGTAVYFSRGQGMPRTLLHNLALNHVLHRTVIVLSIRVEPLPRVDQAERLSVTRFTSDLIGIVARFGYMERVNVPRLLHDAVRRRIVPDLGEVTYVVARVRAIVTNRAGMGLWRKRLYAFMERNAVPWSSNYHLPRERVLDMGMQVEI
ncbi:MAG: potassium transporter Kup [Candidatus Binatia bacterium]